MRAMAVQRQRVASFLRAPVWTLCLPAGLREMGKGAFKSCSSVVSVRVPSGACIGQDAFEGCSGMPAGHCMAGACD